MSHVLVHAPAGIYQGYHKDGVSYFHSVEFLDLESRFAPSVPRKFEPTQTFDATTKRPEEIALSITAPEDAKNGSDYPVLVYIHGGRFESGTHEDPRADGTANALQGVVQVQLGYRVGLEGLVPFKGDEPHRYRAIDDCQVGLEWIQRNIEAFGGDPTNVTLIGQSAGATTALWLTRKDHYRGGFRRVIALSPCFPREHFDARKNTLRAFLGKPITRKSLENTSSKRKARAFKWFRTRYILDMALGPGPLDTSELADVPLLLAATRDEFYKDQGGMWADKRKDGFFKDWIIKKTMLLMGLHKESYDIWKYEAEKIDKTRLLGRGIGDSTIRRWVAHAGDNAPGKTWMVEFTKSSKPALHCDELRYIFGVHALKDEDALAASSSKKLNEWIQSFIRSGVPDGLPEYKDGHDVLDFNLETGEHQLVQGTLDYIYPAFPMTSDEL